MRRTGTVRYFCDCEAGAAPGCVAGDDANRGDRPDRPRRSGAALQSTFNAMSAGDTVALCRGGAFTSPYGPSQSARIYNPRCRPESTCDLRDYTPPAHPDWTRDEAKRPILRSRAYGLFFSDEPQARPNGGYRAFNVQITGEGFGLGFGQRVSDVDVCNVLVRGLQGTGVVFWQMPERIVIRESRFEEISKQGLLGGCTDCVVDRNHFTNTSFGAGSRFDHPVYLTAASAMVARRMRVSNNEIHGCPPGAAEGTVLLVVHGNHEDLVIENNLVACDHPTGDANEWGIGIDDGGYAEPTRFTRTVLRRNRIVGTRLGIELSQAPGSTVESNLVIMSRAGAGDGISVGTVLPGLGDAPSGEVTIRNNSVYYPTAPGRGASGIRVVRDGGHVIANNVVAFEQPADGRCFDLPLPREAFRAISHNACNGDWGTSFDVVRVPLRAPPFAAAGSDFTPAAGSPLVDGGTPGHRAEEAIGSASWSPADRGVRRDVRPDIGAYER